MPWGIVGGGEVWGCDIDLEIIEPGFAGAPLLGPDDEGGGVLRDLCDEGVLGPVGVWGDGPVGHVILGVDVAVHVGDGEIDAGPVLDVFGFDPGGEDDAFAGEGAGVCEVNGGGGVGERVVDGGDDGA